ncbi:uncharacterized protein LOC130665364 [Microplitis mediator]|uniref:uncharacterized protein LOC130665364 n=1 Tax=Microplitis mediator TaxID=375433 RepID=UPI002556AE05|nr:uncharacterized protein LOC130665364 [Microplitis mediator]
MFKNLLLLLLIGFVGGHIFRSRIRQNCKPVGSMCNNDDSECCSNVCYAIGNIGMSSCISVPEGYYTTTPKNLHEKQCIKEHFKCTRHKDCCSKRCIKGDRYYLPSVCKK